MAMALPGRSSRARAGVRRCGQSTKETVMSPRSTNKSAPVARLTGLAAATVLGVTILAAPAGAAAPPDTSLENVRNLVEPSVVRLHTEFEGLVFDRQGNDLTDGK